LPLQTVTYEPFPGHFSVPHYETGVVRPYICCHNRRLPRNPGASLILVSDRGRLYQLFKYVVYAALTTNIFIFFAQESAASPYRFADGFALEEIILGFAATIDTVAWVVLLLMFELETYVLDDNRFTPRVTWSLHGLRAICYGFIVYSFYGYTSKMISLSGMETLPGVNDLCSLVDGAWAYSVAYEEFVVLTLSNCSSFSDASVFLKFPEMAAVIDQDGYRNTMGLAWVDVINSAVWLLVVFVLEIDVRLQERNMLSGAALKISNASKYVLYSILVMALVFWTIEGGFVDSWDSFLWLVAFIFIELNVFDWRQETIEEQQVLNQPAL
jgi:hypothetical protein